MNRQSDVEYDFSHSYTPYQLSIPKSSSCQTICREIILVILLFISLGHCTTRQITQLDGEPPFQLPSISAVIQIELKKVIGNSCSGEEVPEVYLHSEWTNCGTLSDDPDLGLDRIGSQTEKTFIGNIYCICHGDHRFDNVTDQFARFARARAYLSELGIETRIAK
jgi:hypothetical protein